MAKSEQKPKRQHFLLSPECRTLTVMDLAKDREATAYGWFKQMRWPQTDGEPFPALGPIAGAVIADEFGWRAIFVTLGAATVLELLNAVFRWHETRPATAVPAQQAFLPIFRSHAFWTYTLGFSTAIGTFFVFFATAPRVLIDKAGYSELEFSVAFATAAVVMIIMTRFAKRFVAKWGIAGSLARGR